ncbi:DUF6153 family protein [Arthrobacter sulfonylureivorans]|uniref:DUF6153 family protein n=1 Tax=Arthrobacter sulfonylureivorans TaxID=2486855 RepID=UPI0039E44102
MYVAATLQGTVTGRSRPVTVASCARKWALLLGLTAIIAGILGMHIWIGSHNPGNAASAAAVAAAPETGHDHHPGTGTSVMTDQGAPGTAVMSCAGCGDHEMAASMCMLALFMVGAAGLIKPASGVLFSAAGLRGPPGIFPAHTAPLQPPSLIQLSISRT